MVYAIGCRFSLAVLLHAKVIFSLLGCVPDSKSGNHSRPFWRALRPLLLHFSVCSPSASAMLHMYLKIYIPLSNQNVHIHLYMEHTAHPRLGLSQRGLRICLNGREASRFRIRIQ